MPSARSLRPLPRLSSQNKRRLETIEGRLKLCRWSAALSLGIGVGAWSFANVSEDSGSINSLITFTLAVVVCLLATGAGALLESERERLRKG